MTSDYVAGLHDQEEPEQIDCSTGVVPKGSFAGEAGESKEEQEILVPVLTSRRPFFFRSIATSFNLNYAIFFV